MREELWGRVDLFFAISAMPARLPYRVGLGRTGVPGTRRLVRVDKIRSRTLLWHPVNIVESAVESRRPEVDTYANSALPRNP